MIARLVPRFLKRSIRGWLASCGYEIRAHEPESAPPPKLGIPEEELYRPYYSPWLAGGDFAAAYARASARTIVSADRCYNLYSLLRQGLAVPGDVMECGVYKGGTAALLAHVLHTTRAGRKLHLFDTFAGMPATDPGKDWHREGDFSDTTLEAVIEYVAAPDECVFHPGFLPETFAGLESITLCFAHLDLDIYRSIWDALAFIWPRLSVGGIVVLDDYGVPTCPGAKAAVDEFFRQRVTRPLCLSTGQALVFKSVAHDWEGAAT